MNVKDDIYLDWEEWEKEIDFLDTLIFQQDTRKESVENIEGPD